MIILGDFMFDKNYRILPKCRGYFPLHFYVLKTISNN